MVTMHPRFRPRARLTDEAARRHATCGPIAALERALAEAGGRPLVVDDAVIQVALPACRDTATAVIEDGLLELVLLLADGPLVDLRARLPGAIGLALRPLDLDERGRGRLLVATWAVADVLAGALDAGLPAYQALTRRLKEG